MSSLDLCQFKLQTVLTVFLLPDNYCTLNLDEPETAVYVISISGAVMIAGSGSFTFPLFDIGQLRWILLLSAA